MNEIQQEISKMVEKCGVGISELSRELEVTPVTVYNWLNGTRGISKRNLKKLRLRVEKKLPNKNQEINSKYFLEIIKELTELKVELSAISRILYGGKKIMSLDKIWCGICSGSGHFRVNEEYIKCHRCGGLGTVEEKNDFKIGRGI